MIRIKFVSLTEAEGDSKELVKLNADRIRSSKEKPSDTSKIKDFEIQIKKDAELGVPPSLFSKEIIDFFESIDSNALPKTGLKAFVKWLANIILSTKKMPDVTEVEKISDMFEWSNNNESETEWKFNYSWSFQQALDKAKDFSDKNIKSLNQFKIKPKWVLSKDWSIVQISKDIAPEEDIKHDLSLESCDSNMNHCAGTYHVKDVLAGKEIIYSLRNSKNRPHVTLSYSVEYKQFLECKGKSNSVPKEEYLLIIEQWLKDNFSHEEWRNLENIKDLKIIKTIKEISLNEKYELTEEDYKEIENYAKIPIWDTKKVLNILKNILSIKNKIFEYDKKNKGTFTGNTLMKSLAICESPVVEFTIENFEDISKFARYERYDLDDFLYEHLNRNPQSSVDYFKPDIEIIKKEFLKINNEQQIIGNFPKTISILNKKYSAKIGDDEYLEFVHYVDEAEAVMAYIENSLQKNLAIKHRDKIYNLISNFIGSKKLSSVLYEKCFKLFEESVENEENSPISKYLFDILYRQEQDQTEFAKRILKFSPAKYTMQAIRFAMYDKEIVKIALQKFIEQSADLPIKNEANIYHAFSAFKGLNKSFDNHKIVYSKLYQLAVKQTNNFSFEKINNDLMSEYDKADAGAVMTEFLEGVLQKGFVPETEAKRMLEDYIASDEKVKYTQYPKKTIDKAFKKVLGNVTTLSDFANTFESKLFIFDNDKKIFKIGKI